MLWGFCAHKPGSAQQTTKHYQYEQYMTNSVFHFFSVSRALVFQIYGIAVSSVSVQYTHLVFWTKPKKTNCVAYINTNIWEESVGFVLCQLSLPLRLVFVSTLQVYWQQMAAQVLQRSGNRHAILCIYIHAFVYTHTLEEGSPFEFFVFLLAI